MSNTIIIPGDKIPIDNNDGIATSIGPGVYKDPKVLTLIPSTAGLISIKINKNKTNRIVFIESNSKRYIPQVNDFVIGVVTGVIGEAYKVQLLEFSSPTILSMMAFPNATKKNRPNLKIGQAVYARVSQAIPEIDTEIECIDPVSGKEGGFGLLDESGYIFNINLNFARELLFNPNSIVLQKLASKVKFEIAIGINGKIWLKCGDGLKLNDANNDDMEEEPQQSNSFVRDMRATIAASKFIIQCQSTSSENIDKLLTESFRGI